MAKGPVIRLLAEDVGFVPSPTPSCIPRTLPRSKPVPVIIDDLDEAALFRQFLFPSSARRRGSLIDPVSMSDILENLSLFCRCASANVSAASFTVFSESRICRQMR